MSTTNLPHTESAEAPTTAKPERRSPLQHRSPLRRRRALVGFVTAIAGPALLIATLGAVTAGARSDAPATDGGNTSYEECVAAAFAATGPVEEASSAGSHEAGSTPEAPGDAGTTAEKPGGSAAAPEAPDVEEPHPNSPAHEWCTADCPEDELCERPTEFTVVGYEDVEMLRFEDLVSFENPEPASRTPNREPAPPPSPQS